MDHRCRSPSTFVRGWLTFLYWIMCQFIILSFSLYICRRLCLGQPLPCSFGSPIRIPLLPTTLHSRRNQDISRQRRYTVVSCTIAFVKAMVVHYFCWIPIMTLFQYPFYIAVLQTSQGLEFLMTQLLMTNAVWFSVLSMFVLCMKSKEPFV